MPDAISFVLNGNPCSVSVRPDTTVLDLIRNHLSLKGTKEGCAEGDCGACTILLQRPNINGGKHKAANSCIMTAAQIDGAQITTVEGLRQNGVLSAVQNAMAQNGSTQCGFCTPGIAIALTGLLRNNSDPSEAEIHDALAGNLCRCTGYRPIVEAAKKAALEIQSSDKITVCGDVRSTISAQGSTVHLPATIDELLSLRAQFPAATLLAGGTDLGVARAAYDTDWNEIILTSSVPELREITVGDNAWIFGAAVTWAEMGDVIADELPSLATLIRRFGSAQIRSMGTIGGNIGTASPIGDGPPAMIALGATITFAMQGGIQKSMPLEAFFLDYRKTALPQNGVIVSVQLPRPKPSEVFRVYKVSKRYDQDISSVCGAFWLKMKAGKIADARIAFGGMAAVPKRARSAEKALIGSSLEDKSIGAAMAAINGEFSPLSDWRGSSHYRAEVAAGLLKRLKADLNGETVELVSL
ncbi:MAG: xanthine dehydrogenase small subunit [Ahrensia sp.]|nr:xanthine dehydrogenase small subunit [Ahrensia sp.]